MKLLCPNCNKEFDLNEEKINQLKKESDLNMSVIEETDANITALVTKKPEIKSPSVGDIEKNTFANLLPEGEYWKQEFKKEIIVLHFTAGYTWQSAYNVFKQPGRIATPFIIDKEGPKFIIKLFDEKYWSYHLGINGPECKDWINDKRSVGIEIVNIGPAWLRNGVWMDYVKRVWPAEKIVVGKNRDADGGVKFPDEQVKAVCDLVNFLCDKWSIPKKVPKDKMAYQLPAVGKFKGIVTHQMFRQDKYDMGVAWPWDKMKELCGLEEVDLSVA